MFSQQGNKADPGRWFTDLHAPHRGHCWDAGWMSEAHRLSLGANRPGSRTTSASNANRFHPARA